ncbi:MAG: acyl carrier protein [Spirochaetaceae bacterium]|nr:acyl carrier protein [Spirochaetaceae bacterium]MEE0132544.1 acyl carrier protein [Treponema sp.]
MTKELIFSKLQEALSSEFEISPDRVTLDARLFEDLELDSIDAVDMIVKMKPYLTSQVNPEMFKSVKTIQDVVDILEPLTK